MACVSPEGKPTRPGLTMLRSLSAGALSPEAIASATAIPLFRVRSGMRELQGAGYVDLDGDLYVLSALGRAAIESRP